MPSYIFYSKEDAIKWIDNTKFPLVFKLSKGAGSLNVKLIHNKKEAYKLINRAFSTVFSNYQAVSSLKERFSKYKIGKASALDILKGLVRFFIKPTYAKILGKEIGYIYFQKFIPNNKYDIRIIVIGDKAFGLKRMVRKDDFRASGSGKNRYAKLEFDERCVQIAFNITKKLDAQCLTYDFVFDDQNKPLIVEISYGYVKEVYYPCEGYWDEKMTWHEGSFNSQGWMVDLVLDQINNSN